MMLSCRDNIFYYNKYATKSESDVKISLAYNNNTRSNETIPYHKMNNDAYCIENWM